MSHTHSQSLRLSNLVFFVYRYLLSFWPNLQRVVETSGERSTSIELLNQSIRVSRGVAEAKRRIVRRYGAQEAHGLLPAELVDFLLR